MAKKKLPARPDGAATSRSDIPEEILRRLVRRYPDVHGAGFSVRRSSRAGRGSDDEWTPLGLVVGGRAVAARALVLGRWGAMSPEILRRSVHANGQLSDARHPVVTLIVAPYIGEKAKAWLAHAGINYLDLAGNIRIVAPGIYVEREGSARPEPVTSRQRVNPFSRRASLVARALFEGRGEQRIIALAERIDLAQGWVSLVVAALERAGYVTRGREGVRLANAAGLLRDWTNVYNWQRNAMTSFIVPYAYNTLETHLPAVLSGETWALTLLSGADWVAPAVEHQQMHVYVAPGSERSVHDRLEQQLHAKLVPASSAAEARLHVLTPYYGNATFFGWEVIRGMHVVSPLQLYLDLAHFPVRGPEAAAAVLRTALAPQAGLSAAEVDALIADA